MSLASRGYVTREGCVDRASCHRIGREIGATLSEWLQAQRIEGYLVRELYTSDDIADEDLDEGVILEAAENQLPVVWVNVTYRPGGFDPASLGELERQFGLRLAASATSAW